MVNPKQIVIDKDAFVGINLDALCDFAGRHILILPETPLYECATTCKAMQLRLIGRFEKLAGTGSHVCVSVEAMIRCEARNCVSYV